MLLWSDSINPIEIGAGGTQFVKMSDGYPNYSPNSVQLINYDNKLNYTPSLRSFLVEYRAKLTDSMRCGVASGAALLVSEKLLKILIGSKIENYQYFEADVIHRKKHYTYYFFFIYGQNYDLVDYKNMTFYGESQPPYSHRLGTFDIEKIKRKEIKVENSDQIVNWQKLYPDYPNLKYEDLKLNRTNIHVDMIRLPFLLGGGYYVSEDLHNKIIEQKCTGISFRTKDWSERPIL